MTPGFFSILIACALYGILHSLLAAQTTKDWVAHRLGARAMRCYRLFFNLVGGVTVLPLLYLAWRLPDSAIYTIPFPWVLVTGAIQLAAFLGLWMGVSQTGGMAFLGLDAFDRARKPRPARLVTTGLYRYVRHPLYSCGLLILWLIPSMTWNRLALALGLTVYILVAIRFEERRLYKEFGGAYIVYRKRVPALIPGFPPGKK